jgi:hypothetical protein
MRQPGLSSFHFYHIWCACNRIRTRHLGHRWPKARSSRYRDPTDRIRDRRTGDIDILSNASSGGRENIYRYHAQNAYKCDGDLHPCPLGSVLLRTGNGSAFTRS